MGPESHSTAPIARWIGALPSSGGALLAATVGLSLAFQMLFLLVYFHGHAPLAPPDSALYRSLAQALVDGHGYALAGEPTAKVPPLYPLVLAPFVAAGADRALVLAVFGIGLGALSAGLIALIARRAYGPVEGIVAGVLAAGLPTIAFWAPYVLSDTLALALLAGAVLALVNRDGVSPRAAAVGGALLGAGLLTRPAMGFPAAALLTWLFVRRNQRRRFVMTAVAAATMALVLFPWALRNELELGRAYISSSYGGANAWVAVHWLPDGRGTVGRDVPALPTRRGASEPELDDLQRDRATDYLRAHPGRYLRGLYEKPRLLWPLWIPEYGARGLAEVWVTLLAMLALAGFIARPDVRRGGIWWLALAAALTGAVALLYMDSDLRYRLPLAAVVVPPAAAAAVAFARRPPGFSRRPGAARSP